MSEKNIISFSGGKDSTAIYLLAMERGVDFTPIFFDTDNENEITIDYVKDFHKITGGPKVQIYQADFTERFEARRKRVRKEWGEYKKARNKDYMYPPLPQGVIDEAVATLYPTGNVFLDMCLLHGRMPSTRARFCSEELKRDVAYEQVMMPLMEAGHTVISWQGVRADESKDRSELDVVEEVSPQLIIYRPIITWSVDDVLAIAERNNVALNSLYMQGMGRVGCMPCIHARKPEVREIAMRFPGELDRIAEWEKRVAKVNRWCQTFGQSYSGFFGPKTVPGTDMAPVEEVIEWSKTLRGGKQYDLLADEEPAKCTSIYGLCD